MMNYYFIFCLKNTKILFQDLAFFIEKMFLLLRLENFNYSTLIYKQSNTYRLFTSFLIIVILLETYKNSFYSSIQYYLQV